MTNATSCHSSVHAVGGLVVYVTLVRIKTAVDRAAVLTLAPCWYAMYVVVFVFCSMKTDDKDTIAERVISDLEALMAGPLFTPDARMGRKPGVRGALMSTPPLGTA